MEHVYIGSRIYILIFILSCSCDALLDAHPPKMPMQQLQEHIGSKLSGNLIFTNVSTDIINKPLRKGELICVNQDNSFVYALVHTPFDDGSCKVLTSLTRGGFTTTVKQYEVVRFSPPLVLQEQELSIMEQFLTE